MNPTFVGQIAFCHNGDMDHAEEFASKGYARFSADERLAAWASHVAALSPSILDDPACEKWWRHRRTWFVGVDALPNDERGQMPGGPPLAGSAVNFVREQLGFSGPWHKGQLSVCFPGYPQRDANESAAQHNFRLKRDAAHVDGLHGEGPKRRRHYRETHQFILGIPLNVTNENEAPFVVWEGSHRIMQETLKNLFAAVSPEEQGKIDVTESYQAARKRCFETCRRVVLHSQPGGAYVVHRYALHGVSPWIGTGAVGASRMIAYFRPTTLSPIAIGR